MRRTALLVSAVVVILASAGCEPRLPIVRGEAIAIAGNVQRAAGVDWGDPTEALEPPAEAAPDGHRWWQIRYPNGRILVVDAESGWGRTPPAGYVPRVRVRDSAALVPAPMVQEGSLVLELTEPAVLDDDHEAALEREAAQLNAQAAQSGLYPLFSVHHDRQGKVSLLYGWQGDRGIAEDHHAVDWVRLRTTYQEPRWVDLLPLPH